MVVEENCSMHHLERELDLELEIDLAMECAPIGRTIKSALLRAQSEARVIVGLSAAINVLSKSPEGSLFCLMAQPKVGDSATHMHEVLLEAFCYENDIYVIKVDDATKLSRILGQDSVESCCLVQKVWADAPEEQLTKAENQLVDYCEAHWDAPQQPIVQLPAV
ncbi:growth arrest and DNA damage-inducible protein GADD45 alpha [Drosophila sechellia]|uniref:GM20942 n=1 Tax=Drosophila sechellia TaxID=7238 RepID=B4HQS3_DROSE|nr:growth arrest and DNA damage-inducible protein GADD45 alpha [Drosophila sechellia]EDW46733.1 GM20942 [Drosophila sechellia]